VKPIEVGRVRTPLERIDLRERKRNKREKKSENTESRLSERLSVWLNGLNEIFGEGREGRGERIGRKREKVKSSEIQA
jgi:hypothetical protein